MIFEKYFSTSGIMEPWLNIKLTIKLQLIGFALIPLKRDTGTNTTQRGSSFIRKAMEILSSNRKRFSPI